MTARPDPIRDGLASGWRVMGGPHAQPDAVLRCDVLIVGSGAGGGITAEVLATAGMKVLVVEEGPLRSSSDFRQLEHEAYPALYQESAGRKTADKAINILQGRCVGGSTTVNWTSSFRTPPATLAWWRDALGLGELTDEAMAPWFQQVEARLGIAPWLVPPNANNELLRQGALKLGVAAASIQRNVRGCWNLGSCGLGCPTNAKQSMLVTTLPAALSRGASLLVEHRIERLQVVNGRVRGAQAVAVASDGRPLPQPKVRIEAGHVVVAGGAINSPALLLRSEVPDPHRQLGRRTFLHPVVISAAVLAQPVQGWQGAPQTIYSDHFLEVDPIDGPIGFKLEAPPIHPLLFATTVQGFGAPLAQTLPRMPHTHVLLALMRDGFHPEAPGGQVRLRGDGSPELDYPLTGFVMDGARRALRAMAELQFAAGAQAVLPVHADAALYPTWAQAREAIASLSMVPYRTRVVSAHVMGGCAMSAQPASGVVRPDGTHWQIENLSVHDGSVFPTSIGANPQLSVYGLAARMADGLARRLGARPVPLA